MFIRLISVGFFGIAIGAFTGCLVFGTIASALGIASAMGASICGLTIAIGSDETERPRRVRKTSRSDEAP